MPSTVRLSEAVRALRLGTSFLLCGVLAGALLAFGRPSAALGAGLGLALHLTNALFLSLAVASLAERGATEVRERRFAGLAAGASLVARLVFLAFALWLIVSQLGREAFLGAAGGLALAQVSLLIRRFGAKGGA